MMELAVLYQVYGACHSGGITIVASQLDKQMMLNECSVYCNKIWWYREAQTALNWIWEHKMQ